MNGTTHPPAPARTASIAEPDAETLYRAALTFLLDGADAFMVALLKGSPSAEELWNLLAETAPGHSDDGARNALGELDRTFATGIARWGRSVTPQAMNAFHTSLARWHARMGEMPSARVTTLGEWFTAEGTQWIIAPHHRCWPEQVMDLSIRSDWAPPLCLWGKGDPRALVSCPKPIGVVGSRDISDYGRYVAHTVAEQAAAAGHTVVSGGAMGVDAAAHWGALRAAENPPLNHAGRTVAVFAGGLHHMGPLRNKQLFERIEANHGALISELCPGTIPEARRFLLRNRIIAALSSTLVVAQARLRSGALNTAGWAAELEREVYAAPGDINSPVNAGCNAIISQNKAMLLCAATSIEDICHEPHQPAWPSTDPTQPESHASPAAPPKTMPSHPQVAHLSSQAHLNGDADAASESEQSEPISHSTSTVPSDSAERPASKSSPIPDPRDVASKRDRRQEAATARPTTTDAVPLQSTDSAPEVSQAEPAIALTAAQQLMMTLIADCRAQHLHPTPDALLGALRRERNDGDHSIAKVMKTLGELELLGVVDLDGGVATPAGDAPS
ncbi:DNA protecting protein DprA [Bifidobacterium lemurum]|uniref:DNA protecting protein DprA n=1 Tax=Bifidobacterium lemurum TaxID=1603886 RepID=A0A261FMH9_9BIFI|nr:DNA-processing protein DprA [Bifidobacterium lemurum]OZG60308.1 DNA protecting protein DprA [Bifidobacterium lemurum]QOL34186.1 DNA-processing protein DprA [Bifidobacterium lemurum]